MMFANLARGVISTFEPGPVPRFDNGAPLGPREVAMQYRMRDHVAKFGTNAFFFQEGLGDLYRPARYGEFKVSSSGEAILTALRDPNFNVLGPPSRR